jgi:iron complex outermembrane receptor protein
VSALRPFVVCGCLGLLVAPAVLAGEGAPRLSQLERPSTEAAPLLGQAVPEPQPAAAPPPGDGEELEEVTVFGTGGYRRKNATSGTKTDTPILITPQSIQVIPRQVIEDQGAIRLDEALRNVSGVSTNNGAGRLDTFNIRGFSSNQFLNGIPDDFNVSITFRESANLERIEVVKGPASVLFGRAQPSGIINLITKKPLARPYAAVDLTVGSYSFWRPTVDLSGPLTADGALAYRLNLAYEDAGSFRDGVYTSRTFVAPVLRWNISPETTLTFEGEHLRDSRPLDIIGLPVTPTGYIDIPINRVLGNARELIFSNQNRFTAILEHRFSPAVAMRTALRYTNFTESRPAGSTLPGRVLADGRTLTLDSFRCNSCRYIQSYFLQNDLTWKFETGGIQHTALLGLEFGRFDSRVNFEGATGGSIDIFDPQYPVRYSSQYRTTTNAISRIGNFGVYLQDQLTLFENTHLVLSGRFDTYSAEDFNFLTDRRIPTYAEAFSPRVGLLWQPDPSVSLFANFSRSFTPTTGISAEGTPFLPERGEGYEVGAKAELAKGRLFANLALYRITKNNVLTADPANPGFSIQTGQQQSQGIEFDITGEILPGWNLIASYAYTDARLTQDNTFPVGNQLVNIPRHSGSLWTAYRLQEGALRGLGLGFGVFAVGERAGNLAGDFTLPGYARTDAALYYSRDNLRAALNFKNLFDVRYIAGAEARGAFPGQPFTVQGTIGWQF